MNESMKRWFYAYGCGSLAALFAHVLVWLCWRADMFRRLGSALSPGAMPAWLYAHVVWGGLAGLLFLVPAGPPKTVPRGLTFALIPALLFLIFECPYGRWGTRGSHGWATPLLVYGVFAVWGMITAALTNDRS